MARRAIRSQELPTIPAPATAYSCQSAVPGLQKNILQIKKHTYICVNKNKRERLTHCVLLLRCPGGALCICAEAFFYVCIFS
jgi:hypothetical protein